MSRTKRHYGVFMLSLAVLMVGVFSVLRAGQDQSVRVDVAPGGTSGVACVTFDDPQGRISYIVVTPVGHPEQRKVIVIPPRMRR